MTDIGSLRGRRLEEPELERLLLEGARLFDEGAFFESHEAWEYAWHGATQTERDFFQGLIHAAAACLHHQRGNAHGFDRQKERLVRRLGRYGPSHRGVDTKGLVQRICGLPAPGKTAIYPRLGLDGSVHADPGVDGADIQKKGKAGKWRGEG
jgi:uncharacterized protein